MVFFLFLRAWGGVHAWHARAGSLAVFFGVPPSLPGVGASGAGGSGGQHVPGEVFSLAGNQDSAEARKPRGDSRFGIAFCSIAGKTRRLEAGDTHWPPLT